MRNYIKIDLYGQFDDDTRHECTYPVKLANQYSFTEETVWAKSISDPRGLHGKVCKAGSDCYVMWGNRYGNYISYITRNPNDSRGGMAMVTFFVERRYVCDGRDILSALKNLTTRLIYNADYSYSSIEKDIANARISESSHGIPVRESGAVPTTDQKLGYRTYETEEELVDIFTFIEQKDYSNYDKIIVSRKDDIKENIGVPHITGTVLKYYSIVNQADARSNTSFIHETDSFKIVYSKEGFDNQSVECHRPFVNGKFYQVDGNIITIYDAQAVNVDFTRTWYFDISKSTDGAHVSEDKVEITVNGRPTDKSFRKLIRFTESEMLKNGDVMITVSGEHFLPYEAEINLNNFTKNNAIIRINITPIMRKIRIKFIFNETLKTGPVFLEIDETSPYYDDLINNQRFCGYYAWKDNEGTYHVDIPRNPKPLRLPNYNDECSQRRLPRWAKHLILTLFGLAITGLIAIIILCWGDIAEFCGNLFNTISD